jgi:hypothetical protein
VITWQELLAREIGGTITIKVSSTAVESVDYHVEEQSMDVTMTDGSTWPYPDGVPAITPDMLLAFVNGEGFGGSVGRFFNARVRGRW